MILHPTAPRRATRETREEQGRPHEHMLGSCCEEQERQEAEVRSRIRAATKLSESRLMRGHFVRSDIHRALRCGDACCMGCGECEEEEDEAPKDDETQVGEEDDDDDDFFDDDDEQALMAKMRSTRMGQLRDGAEAAARQRAILGTHARVREGESLAALLRSTAQLDHAIILHLAVAGNESAASDDACLWVEDAMSKAAAGFASTARLLTQVHASATEVPEWLDVPALPALLTLESGAVSAVLAERLDEQREPLVRTRVATWLEAERVRLESGARARAAALRDEDDDDEQQDSYCGRPGCRAYPHEHVGGRAPGSAQGDPFAR
jgi:hypothetical protein